MSHFDPLFASFTWGASGSTANKTTELCTTAQTLYGLESCMHLTCTNVVKEVVEKALKEAKDAGIQNILALRGDPPRGQEYWTTTDEEFQYAIDLVRFIKKEYGDYFCIGVAGYPEGYPESNNKSQDLLYLKEKVDAGADFIISQLFYDVDLFINWEKNCRKIGISVPIIPCIMPIQGYHSFRRITNLCKIYIPPQILNDLEPIKHDDQAVKDYGVNLAISIINKLYKEHKILGFQLCTMNLEKSIKLILERLKFIETDEEKINNLGKKYRPNVGFATNDIIRQEDDGSLSNVKPVIWKEQSGDYLGRSEDWDNFPNGRWGDARSPVSSRITAEMALEYWKEPTSISDIIEIFKSYVLGDIPALPWSEEPLLPESEIIRSNLIKLNELGYLTISSQPSVNGVKSDDSVFGWGPKDGYVYQKAFVEFFVSKEILDNLIEKLLGNPWSSAVTWGVFPGKEIVQPTIIDEVSFKAWKDESFALWEEWQYLYKKGSETQKLLKGLGGTWWLVNIVYHDYVNSDGIWNIFFE
nr:5695_t:CDS:10 [Entrophospora candida]